MNRLELLIEALGGMSGWFSEMADWQVANRVRQPLTIIDLTKMRSAGEVEITTKVNPGRLPAGGFDVWIEVNHA